MQFEEDGWFAAAAEAHWPFFGRIAESCVTLTLSINTPFSALCLRRPIPKSSPPLFHAQPRVANPGQRQGRIDPP
jgi:hypothetical protein